MIYALLNISILNDLVPEGDEFFIVDIKNTFDIICFMNCSAKVAINDGM